MCWTIRRGRRRKREETPEKQSRAGQDRTGVPGSTSAGSDVETHDRPSHRALEVGPRHSISTQVQGCVVSPLFLPTVTAGSIAPLSPSDMKLRIRSDTLRGCRAASGPPALAKSPQPPPNPPLFFFFFTFFKRRMAARGRGALVSPSAVMEM